MMNNKLLAFIIILTITIIGVQGAIKCQSWREILPCDCNLFLPLSRTTVINCQNMNSFEQVVEILRKGRFNNHEKVFLQLERSSLNDLQFHQFREINVTIETLRINHDHLDYLVDNTFAGMVRVTFLSFADTPINAIPSHLWKFMPNIQTADLGRCKIKEILYDSFEGLQDLATIILPGNQISRIDRNSVPHQIQRLHFGRNKLYHLNGTLNALTNLSWIFLNSNEFIDLDGQLPTEALNLRMFHASDNRLIRVPHELCTYPRLENLFLNNNQLTSLDNLLATCRALSRLDLQSNQIHTLTVTDFQYCQHLDTLDLSYNQITSLNNSLLALEGLEILDLHYNLLTEFSFSEIYGLEKLRKLDLSFNQISTLVGSASNLVEPNIRLTELNLEHNFLEVLNAALSGLSELLRLNLSYNKLRRISPDDFINLDQLRLLDISHNQLKTLEEMSKTYLPRLSELKATHNQLKILEHDFDGLPILCIADLSSNKIIALGRELVMKTRCKFEHGVHEGTWDTLKIDLSHNEILCDAALPEITSEMETNHTKIIGFSYCPPLIEQSTTTKPNGFLGYIPSSEQSASNLPNYLRNNNYAKTSDTPNQIENKIFPTSSRDFSESRRNYEETQAEILRQPLNDQPSSSITVNSHNNNNNNNNNNETDEDILIQPSSSLNNNDTNNKILLDPIMVQSKLISKLTTEIEDLKTKVEIISNQTRLLNKTNFAKIP